ncbi:unnamed protein product [Chondrus crispus]|uniref:Uncharacterized protein n=1 Tax=Chondrus crispus TaxID=2769 RepID=R7QS96_CHOCR|nr:unnamed protein product [Chondrus crispus]CDF40608.1 unnamed protein product [Chondrus crispus]|eukprot:XP_005710902.1 unnamed protein product [Chondrus crispus]
MLLNKISLFCTNFQAHSTRVRPGVQLETPQLPTYRRPDF